MARSPAPRKEAGRGIIIAANKWDLMKDQGPDASKVFDENVRYHLKFLDYAPILHISAVTGERTPKLLEVVDRSPRRAARACSTGELNRFIEKITTPSPPVTAGKRNVRVMYASQTSVAPPTFVLFTNAVTKLHFSYERFLENRLARDVRILRQPDSHPGPRPQGSAKGAAHRRGARARAAEAGEKGPGLKANAGHAREGRSREAPCSREGRSQERSAKDARRGAKRPKSRKR